MWVLRQQQWFAEVWKQSAAHSTRKFRKIILKFYNCSRRLKMSGVWKMEVAENVQRELKNMEPQIASYLRKLVQEEASNDWGQALVVMDLVHKELVEVKAQLQKMGKGEIPPSHSIQTVVARLEALEQDHAQLKTDVRLLLPAQDKPSE
ncbi:MAG: hypothetical protein BCS36_11255 [Desulfovibrio sp. MES5]|nr:MAG: hypothetical protein BCS36_11255 [Desulfovibrio sp. MES5]